MVGGEVKDDKKGHCTVRGNDDYDNYEPPHLESEAAAASPDL